VHGVAAGETSSNRHIVAIPSPAVLTDPKTSRGLRKPAAALAKICPVFAQLPALPPELRELFALRSCQTVLAQLRVASDDDPIEMLPSGTRLWKGGL
jgi:hypothetical protein